MYYIVDIKKVQSCALKKVECVCYMFISGQGSPGWLPSSVEYSQFPSAVASQAHEGPSYQRRNTQSK